MKNTSIMFLMIFLLSGCSSGSKDVSVSDALLKVGLEEAVGRCAYTLDGKSQTVSNDTHLQAALDFISSDEGKQIDEYYNILWASLIPSEREDELASVCNNLIETNSDFSNLYKPYLEKSKQAKAESEAEAIKFAPLLQKLDDKFYKAGMGGVRDYLAASASTYNLIRKGAAYSFSGVSRGEVEDVDCEPTTRSFWRGGIPDNWWSCWIDFVGSDGEYYSIEFNGNSWSGKPDGGLQAGSTLKGFDVPEDLLNWLRKQL